MPAAPRSSSRPVAALVLGASLLAVACGATNSSPHPHDFVFDEGTRYEKNPEVTLAREYWVIGVPESGERFLLPRPDGHPRIAAECAANGPLAELFRGARLCEAAASTAAVERINALSADEARRTSTFLHAELRFVVGEQDQVSPYALTSDVRDVCERFPADRAGELREECDREAKVDETGSRALVGYQRTRAQSEVLAARLNEIYGIPAAPAAP